MNRTSDPRFDAAAVSHAIASAGATDALDAVQIDTAAELFAAASGQSPLAANVPATVASTCAPLLARRRERAAAGFAPQDALVRALLPAPAGPNDARRGGGTSQLTEREMKILELLAQQLSNREIAQRFTLSPRTVDTHVERVLSIDATSRTRAVATALRLGLVKST